MRRSALWVIVILAAALVGVFAGLSWRDRAAAPPARPEAPEAAARTPTHSAPPTAQAPADPYLQIEGTVLSAADPAGRPLWELRAAQLSVDNAKQRVVLTRVSGQFYSHGVVQVRFTAPNAVFLIASRDVEMTGGVVGRTADGRVLRASRLRWSARERAMLATGSVVLTQRGVAIHSDRLVADAELDQVRFSGNVLVRVVE